MLAAGLCSGKKAADRYTQLSVALLVDYFDFTCENNGHRADAHVANQFNQDSVAAHFYDRKFAQFIARVFRFDESDFVACLHC